MYQLSDAGKRHFKKLASSQFIVWFMMAAALVSMTVAANVSQLGTGNPAQLPSAGQLYPAFATMLLFAAVFLGRYSFSERSLTSMLKNCRISEGSESPLLRKLPLKEAQAYSIAVTAFVFWLLALMMSEMATILGFIHSKLSGEPSTIYPYVLGSFLVHMLLVPKGAPFFQRIVERVTDNSDPLRSASHLR